MLFSQTRLSDLPTLSQLEEARGALRSSEKALDDISEKIRNAEDELTKVIEETRQTISNYTAKQAAIQQEVALIRAFIAPIRRLPNDLLREIFLICFEHNASSAWTLAAVCTGWRRLALSVHSLWSRIRLELTQNDSPDIIRLWLERSGLSCPLDIEITLQVSHMSGGNSVTSRPRRGARTCLSYPPVSSPPLPSGNNPPLNSHGLMLPSFGFLSPPYSHSNSPSPSTSNSSSSQQQAGRASSWGYIAFYYLTSQMERWERFVFRFDRTFSSIQALKSISG